MRTIADPLKAAAEPDFEVWSGYIVRKKSHVKLKVKVPVRPKLPTSGLPAGEGLLEKNESMKRTISSSTDSTEPCAEDGSVAYFRSSKRPGPLDRGYPGYLTPQQAEVLELFRKEVRRRGSSFREAVFCLGADELEDYALCRWLRARNFVYEDVVNMVEQAAMVRAEPRRRRFYPDAREALGVEESIMKTQYPQCFTGQSKSGNPLFFSKPGLVNINGVGAVTSPEGLNRYQWHSNMHVFQKRLKERQAEDPSFKRFQSVVIMDLEHLSRAQLNSKVYQIIQHQSKIDSLCFPEVLRSCVIINAPTFFSAAWMIIKKFLDPGTTAKIEIYSFRSSGEKRLKELIDEDQLPADYGGKAPSIMETIISQDSDSGANVSRQITKLLHIKAHGTVQMEIVEGEELDVIVFTRSTDGAVFSIKEGKKKEVMVSPTTVRCPEGQSGENDDPFHMCIGSELSGPGIYKICAEAHKGRMSSPDDFLVLGKVRKI